jgi:serine/threonine protein kinase
VFSKIAGNVPIRYQASGRKPSVTVLEDPETKEQTEFTPELLLCKTRFSIIRLFRNPLGETIIIKSLKSPIERESFETDREFNDAMRIKIIDVKYELTCMQMAYPDEAPYGFFCPDEGERWSYRLVMPYIKGNTFQEYASVSHKDTSWLLFFIAIARELNRIHHAGVIHGDIKADNGMVKINAAKDDYNVHFIDFGISYYMNDPGAVVTHETGENTKYWPPERRGIKTGAPRVAPSPKQDIFSYGHMVLGFMDKVPEFRQKYKGLFFSMAKTQNENPEQRPSLDEIITTAGSYFI